MWLLIYIYIYKYILYSKYMCMKAGQIVSWLSINIIFLIIALFVLYIFSQSKYWLNWICKMKLLLLTNKAFMDLKPFWWWITWSFNTFQSNWNDVLNLSTLPNQAFLDFYKGMILLAISYLLTLQLNLLHLLNIIDLHCLLVILNCLMYVQHLLNVDVYILL